MKRSTILELDNIIETSLSKLAADEHVRKWKAKERDWVNYFAHRYLLEQRNLKGIIQHPAQIGIEVAVPQPPKYTKLSVARDIVIWPKIGMTCWNQDWTAIQHPLAIIEWKVHREKHRNQKVHHEREWLREYSKWQPTVLAYAIEVNGDKQWCPINCWKFFGGKEVEWLKLQCS